MKSSRPNLNPSAPRPPHLYEPSLPSSSAPRPSPPQPRPQSSYHTHLLKRHLPTPPGHPDARLALVPRAWLAGRRILDVGSGLSSGWVAIEIARRGAGACVVGVERDREGVRLAGKNVELEWSRMRSCLGKLQSRLERGALTREPEPEPDPEVDTPSGEHYFPISLPRMFGYLPHPPRRLLKRYIDAPVSERDRERGTGTASGNGRKRRGTRMPVEVMDFPENIKFRVAEWETDEIGEDREGYHVILAFSITKWIHLHSLNAGLYHFFTKAFKTLLPGGILILEPHPFQTYLSGSTKLSDDLKRNYELMKEGNEMAGVEKGWRDEEGTFERILLDVGFERKERLGVTGKGASQKPVDAYFKPGGSWL